MNGNPKVLFVLNLVTREGVLKSMMRQSGNRELILSLLTVDVAKLSLRSRLANRDVSYIFQCGKFCSQTYFLIAVWKVLLSNLLFLIA